MQSHIVIKESANFTDVTGDSTEPEDCCDQCVWGWDLLPSASGW